MRYPLCANSLRDPGAGYYDFVSRIGEAERDAELAKKIQAVSGPDR